MNEKKFLVALFRLIQSCEFAAIWKLTTLAERWRVPTLPLVVRAEAICRYRFRLSATQNTGVVV